jgi:hypothetical protein
VLFRTVYGAELEAIFKYIQFKQTTTLQEIADLFIVASAENATVSNSSIDDALSFLLAADILRRQHEHYSLSSDFGQQPFALIVLKQLARIAHSLQPSDHQLNPYFWLLLQDLFIQPNRLYVADVHAEANRLPAIAALGGISREKINAWKRVMEYLGLGYRAFGGFVLLYTPQLLYQIACLHVERSQSLQKFLEERVVQYLPCTDATGNLAEAVALPLLYLHEQGLIELHAIPDAPSRDYFGAKRYKGLLLKAEINNDSLHRH